MLKVSRRDIIRIGFCLSKNLGPHEWNVQLAEPMVKQLVAGWEKTFSRRTPVVMGAFARHAATCLKKFHHDIDARARKVGAGIAGLSMLQQQVGAYEAIFKDLSSTVKDTILAHQKETNREFVPVIMSQMEFAYETCVNESGPGSYARMKAHMNAHIAHYRQTMFRASTEKVQMLLGQLIKTVEVQMGEKTDEVFVSMRRDYRAVLGNGEVKEAEILPRPQRLCRKEIKRVIDGVKRIFEKLANGELDGDEMPLEEKEEQEKSEDGAMSDVEAIKAIGIKKEGDEDASEGTTEGSTKGDQVVADKAETASVGTNAEVNDTVKPDPTTPRPSHLSDDPPADDGMYTESRP